MKLISDSLQKCLKYRSFRVLLAYSYPIIKRLGIIRSLQILNKGSFSEPWIHFKDYDSLDKKFEVDFNALVKQRKEYKFAFIINKDSEHKEDFVYACNILGIKSIFYDFRDQSLYKELPESGCDGVFIHPSYNNNLERNLFHEVTHILTLETGLKIYPTPLELYIYDSKRVLANFLAINNIPHPATSVFYDYATASEFIMKSDFPLIFKTHIGASSSGVEKLLNQKQALRLARNLFKKYYLRKMVTEKREIEWGYMILQEYIEDAKEFRIIKAGDSWFGYQKWKNEDQDFMSGSGIQKWINPTVRLLDFCYEIAVKHSFTTMCFDIFENKREEYLVNELQTWFGSYDPTEMCVDNIPGRYRKIEGEWVFEPGYFNIFGTNLLRLTHFISLLQDKRST